MNKEIFKLEVEKLGIKLTEKEENLLDIYYKFLNEYNEHTNLTAITEECAVYLKHFYDSLTVTRAIDLNSITSVIDIGSGAGFPGAVLKIFYPHLRLTVLDSNNKKTKFLESLVEKLELEGVKVINQRAEDYAKNHHGEYDLCVSRAVAFVDIIASISLPFIKTNGKVILMKGSLENELPILEKYASEIGIASYDVKSFNLPGGESERNLVVLSRKDTIKDLNYAQIVKRNKKWTTH